MKGFLCALTFLTRIPVPGNYEYSIDDFHRSIFYFPVIGAIIGGILAGSWLLLIKFFPVPIVAALLLFIHVLLTGGLHLDGLMDTVDGVYGGRTREDKLAIMKDVHAGAFGVIGVVLVLLLKFSIYTQLNQSLILFLVVAPVMGRQTLVWLQVLFPYARKQGMGKLFNGYASISIVAITTGITLMILVFLLQTSGIIIFLTTGIFAMLLATSLTKMLGGLTGDTYGTACELTEAFTLLVAIILVL